MSRQVEANKYISSSYHACTNLVKGLRWVHFSDKPGQGKGVKINKKRVHSKSWDFMGWLVKEDGNLFGDNRYCRLCLVREQQHENPTVSKIYGTSLGTGSGNWLQHAAKEHQDYNLNDEDAGSEKKQQKLMPWLTKLKNDLPCSSQWEFNRDLGVMICRDLLPFELADKPGFSEVIKKNCQFPVPTASSLSSTVLTDIYSSVKASVIQVLKNMTAATIMMDGWTDKYNALPYFAVRLRLSTIISWKYHSAAC